MSLRNKKILLGITGSISAYKAAYLCRLLVKEGATVKVLMTEFAKEFISPLTMSTLSGHPVLEATHDSDTGEWNSHVELGMWADMFLIAPASLNTMGKMAHGIADNLLTTTYVSAKCPVIIAPAMDLDMYKHQVNQDNIAKLKKYGCHFIEPESGELASGLCGKGRLAEPDIILDELKKHFNKTLPLINKTYMVTAGPTYEKIDPVRYIGNYSSGKMGFAIAETLAENGADVILITGPTAQKTIHENIERIDIFSADDLYKACMSFFPTVDGAVMAAAVADYTPGKASEDKMKRKSDKLKIELSPTKDIAAELGEIKTKKQMLVGFALETSNEEKNAGDKLKRKNLDFVVLNSLKDKGAGFNYDTNKISIIDKSGKIDNFKLKKKNEVAADIVHKMIELSSSAK
ncbi:MAG TPA: bifunctional phosphopantothenoylcysteine decarboxylase/phosphopantothenate--cysteine ligase CoaBC [Bacteroidales bacterium]|nr:bifunctional phosphopantothenoylcysteine decarboxylase/phosphopantothenate--cysteine ligase CoaBC [Bacteroidales bacterium]